MNILKFNKPIFIGLVAFLMLTSCENEEDKAWQAAVSKGSVEAIDSFMLANPESGYKAEADAKKEAMAWAYAKSKNTIYAYKKYLMDYPSGKYKEEVNAQLDSIPAIPVDEESLTVLTTNAFTGKIDYGNQVIQIIYLKFLQIEETTGNIRFVANINASNIRKSIPGSIKMDDFTISFDENTTDKVLLNLVEGKAYKVNNQIVLESINTDQYWRLEQN
ncbi:MAG: hypothetical protein GY810_01920 [Aureispira sp.]|nr:hypothetical protein [Aureispira sp.]